MRATVNQMSLKCNQTKTQSDESPFPLQKSGIQTLAKDQNYTKEQEKLDATKQIKKRANEKTEMTLKDDDWKL